jgi:hypothetical protein
MKLVGIADKAETSLILPVYQIQQRLLVTLITIQHTLKQQVFYKYLQNSPQNISGDHLDHFQSDSKTIIL